MPKARKISVDFLLRELLMYTSRLPYNIDFGFSLPVHGGWAGWEASEHCSQSCGPGTQPFGRTCTSPTPAHGGSYCPESPTKVENCNLITCPGEATNECEWQFQVLKCLYHGKKWPQDMWLVIMAYPSNTLQTGTCFYLHLGTCVVKVILLADKMALFGSLKLSLEQTSPFFKYCQQ